MTASFVILKISSSMDWLMPASHFQIMHLHRRAILSIVLASFRQPLRSPKRTSAEAFQSSFIAPRARTEPGFLWLTISCNAKTVPFSRQWKECVLYGLSRLQRQQPPSHCPVTIHASAPRHIPEGNSTQGARAPSGYSRALAVRWNKRLSLRCRENSKGKDIHSIRCQRDGA